MKKELKEYCCHYTKLIKHQKNIEHNGLSKKLLNELFLDVHSTKGVVIGLGDERLANEIHRFESFLLNTKKFDDVRVKMLHTQLDRITFKVKRRLSSEEVDLKDYFQQLAKNIAEIAGKNVKTIYNYSGQSINKWESRLLRELITPIIINSVDHGIEKIKEREKLGKTKTGKIDIKIECTKTDLIVSVIDDGKGIGFDESRDVSLLSGRKLGLRFVNWQVEEMYGEVQYKSVEKKGSEIKLYMKRVYNHCYAA